MPLKQIQIAMETLQKQTPEMEKVVKIKKLNWYNITLLLKFTSKARVLTTERNSTPLFYWKPEARFTKLLRANS